MISYSEITTTSLWRVSHRGRLIDSIVYRVGRNAAELSEREGFESGCGAGFDARTSVRKLNIVSATHNNSVSDTFSWLARILMASEDVTWGDRMGGESETLASAAESWVSSECGLWGETEEAVFLELRRYILPVITLSYLYDHTTQWRDYNNNNDNFNSPILVPRFHFHSWVCLKTEAANFKP